MQEALSGIRVLDLGRVLSAPFCASILSDFGADVIKIEQPGVGDETRDFFPRLEDESGYFVTFNRGKKGITLNLKHPRGKELFLKLVTCSDVVLSNFRPGVMEKLGLSYEALKKEKPGIIYATISGFGSKGPYAKRGGYDTIAQAMSGLMSLTGPAGGLPTRVGASVADVMAGLHLTVGILAAIRHKEKTGRGQALEVSLADVAVESIADRFQSYFTTGDPPVRGQSNSKMPVFDQLYQTGDGYLVICGLTRSSWNKFCIRLGRLELCMPCSTDCCAFNPEERGIINRFFQTWLINLPSEAVLELLWSFDIPAAPVLRVDEAARQLQIRARGMFSSITQPHAGQVILTAPAIKTTQAAPYIHGPAPLLGEHNPEVYENLLGLAPSEYQYLLESNII